MQRPIMKFVLLTTVIAISGCSAAPPSMQEPTTYSRMSCAELAREQHAVDANHEYWQDASKEGVLDILGAVVEAAAMANGNYDIASQQRLSNQNYSQTRAGYEQDAEAYRNRSELISKVRAIKNCN